jgi:hypothetical protein
LKKFSTVVQGGALAVPPGLPELKREWVPEKKMDGVLRAECWRVKKGNNED